MAGMSTGIKEQYGTFDATIGMVDVDYMNGWQFDSSFIFQLPVTWTDDEATV